ncbi:MULTISPECIES: putative leader peptide [unclassified Streptomyces]
MHTHERGRTRCPGSFQSRVSRRHVDLLRVNSALCPGISRLH